MRSLRFFVGGLDVLRGFRNGWCGGLVGLLGTWVAFLKFQVGRLLHEKIQLCIFTLLSIR